MLNAVCSSSMMMMIVVMMLLLLSQRSTSAALVDDDGKMGSLSPYQERFVRYFFLSRRNRCIYIYLDLYTL